MSKIYPEVPFDLELRPRSRVFYRYGAFIRREAKDHDGKIYSVIYDPAGNPVPDAKDNPKPEWISDPFGNRKVFRKSPAENPLETTYKIFQAVRQRVKGGTAPSI